MLVTLEGTAVGGSSGEQNYRCPQELQAPDNEKGRQAAQSRNRGQEGLPSPLPKPAASGRGEDVVLGTPDSPGIPRYTN